MGGTPSTPSTPEVVTTAQSTESHLETTTQKIDMTIAATDISASTTARITQPPDGTTKRESQTEYFHTSNETSSVLTTTVMHISTKATTSAETSTTSTPTNTEENYVIAITLGSLMIVLIFIGIAIIYLLLKNRSLTISSQQLSQSVGKAGKSRSNDLDYDVTYPPRNSINSSYNQIDLGNENKTFQEDEYYELRSSEVNKNSHSSERDNSEVDGPNHTQRAITPAIEPNGYGIIIQQNGHDEQDECARKDSKGSENLTPHVCSVPHEYDLPPDAGELIEDQSSDTAVKPPLYENLQNVTEETRSKEFPAENFKGDENLNGSTKLHLVSSPDEENPDMLYSHISTKEQ